MTSAFNIDPPTITIRGESIKLRPYTLAFEQKVLPMLRELLGNPSDAELGTAAILAFAVFHSMSWQDAQKLAKDRLAVEQAIQEAEWELAAEDFQAISSYTRKVITGANEATVSVDSSPGKP